MALGLILRTTRMPFAEQIKFCLLGASIAIFIVALAILIWQLHKYCTETPNSQTIVSDLLTDGICRGHEIIPQDTQRPDYKVGLQHAGVDKLSQNLSPCSSISDLPTLSEHEEDPVQGSLRFSLFYDQFQSRLVVTVLAAQDLLERGYSRGVDPFVRVFLLFAAKEGEEAKPSSTTTLRCVLQEWQTRRVKNSTSPAFGDQFSCTLAEEDVPSITVRLEVRDFDKYSRQGILGEVRVSLGELNISYPLELQEDLQRPMQDIVGEVLLSLKHMPISQRLEVGVLKIRALPKSTKTEKALYVRTAVQCNQCKLRHQKTSAKTRWEMTIFNEVLIFMLPDAVIRECTITVTVYEVRPGKRSSKRLIGQIRLGKGKTTEDEHWKLMTLSPRQPIAQWHSLYI